MLSFWAVGGHTMATMCIAKTWSCGPLEFRHSITQWTWPAGRLCYVLQLMGTPAESALEYAQKKIDHNFSNYSAWHSRTALLPVAHGEPQQQSTGSEIAGLLAGGMASGAAAAAAGAMDPGHALAEMQQSQHADRESPGSGAAVRQEGSNSSSAGAL